MSSLKSFIKRHRTGISLALTLALPFIIYGLYWWLDEPPLKHVTYDPAADNAFRCRQEARYYHLTKQCLAHQPGCLAAADDREFVADYERRCLSPAP